MNGELAICSWIRIDHGCPVSCSASGSGEVRMLCGRPADEFEIVFDVDALREFVKVGAEAVEEADAIFAREEAAHGQQG